MATQKMQPDERLLFTKTNKFLAQNISIAGTRLGSDESSLNSSDRSMATQKMQPDERLLFTKTNKFLAQNISTAGTQLGSDEGSLNSSDRSRAIQKMPNPKEIPNSELINNVFLPVISHRSFNKWPSSVKESNLSSYQTPKSKTDLTSVFSHEPTRNLELSSASSTSRKIYQNYPRIEHVTSNKMRTIKEKTIEKEITSEQQNISKFSAFDLNRISDQVYSMIEKRIRIERERRGLYG